MIFNIFYVFHKKLQCIKNLITLTGILFTLLDCLHYLTEYRSGSKEFLRRIGSKEL